ncbi:hypothetical protein AB4874_10210 [Thioclava sp. 15-R06ZXC-3]|uniref:Uncharacterized protein n=1 Tax=Thioclava arctica TaxID=3238301 RepID=A0ABV3TMJ8_9RHOB
MTKPFFLPVTVISGASLAAGCTAPGHRDRAFDAYAAPSAVSPEDYVSHYAIQSGKDVVRPSTAATDTNLINAPTRLRVAATNPATGQSAMITNRPLTLGERERISADKCRSVGKILVSTRHVGTSTIADCR